MASIPIAVPAATAEKPAASSFVSFPDFIHATAGASYASYMAAKDGSVRSRATFAQMRSYILNLYHGVQVMHSFMLDGRYVDCVTISSQPSAQGQRIGKIPSLAGPGAAAGEANGQPDISPLTLGLGDAYGNAVSCPNGTIPMARVSLGETTAFPSLSAYLDFKPAASLPHRYAQGRQIVSNLGAVSQLSIWNPKGYFSDSQQWIAAGSGAATQTVEAGWINFPGHFHWEDSVPFVFFTPDDYAGKDPCYDLDCKDTFVQLDKNFMLGMPFAHYSTRAGKQYSLGLIWRFTDSRWYLYVRGTVGNYVPLGYYPASLFKDGPMSKKSERITFGGETVSNNGTWPAMGSGEFAAAGPGKAALQTDIGFWGYPYPAGQVADLKLIETDPKCYTTAGANRSGTAPGVTYIYFGGPGGKC
jgi:Neprosin